MPVSIIDRIPKRQYTKTEVCQILSDPENFLSGNTTAIKRISSNDTRKLKNDIIKAKLLPVFGISEQEYDLARYLKVTWCELIFERLM